MASSHWLRYANFCLLFGTFIPKLHTYNVMIGNFDNYCSNLSNQNYRSEHCNLGINVPTNK